MTTEISEEEIAMCRCGPDNDIDLKAVFGGRISGRKQKGLKENPLYDDSSYGDSGSHDTGQGCNHHDDISGVQVVTYESIPRNICNRNTEFRTEQEAENLTNSEIKYPNTPANMDNQVNYQDNQNKTEQTDVNNTCLDVLLEPNNENSANPKPIVITKADIEDTKQQKIRPAKPARNGIINKHRNNASISSVANSETSIEECVPNGDIKTHKDLKDSVGTGDSSTESNNENMSADNSMTVPVTDSQENDNSQGVGNGENVNDNGNEKIKLIKPKSNGYQLLGYSNEGLEINENEENKANDSGCIECKNNLLNISKRNGSVKSSNSVNESLYVQDNVSDNSKICTEVVIHTSFYSEKNSSISTDLQDSSIGVSCRTIKSIERQDSDGSINKSNWSELSIENVSDWPDIDEIAQAQPIKNEDIELEETVDGNFSIDKYVYLEVSETVTEVTSKSLSTKEDGAREENENKDTTNSDSDENLDVTKYYSIKSDIRKNLSHASDKIRKSSLDKNNEDHTHCSFTSDNVSTKHETDTNGASSTRTLKSILSITCSESESQVESPTLIHKHRQSESEIQELKSVKFSDDTVFNENKPKKYKTQKMEIINLREIYRGKISSDSAVAKMNPLYQDDDEGIVGEDNGLGSLTEDEKMAYQIALRKMMANDKKGNKSSLDVDHMMILRAHGLKPANTDIEALPEEIERPAYDRLIQRTIAKERRKLIVKWSLVFLTVTIITTVATVLGVYFKEH